jgi:hypothetical protein
MPEFEHYERHLRRELGEEWHLRGRLRDLYLSGGIDGLERILGLSERILQERRRRLLRFSFGERPYLVKVYRASGLSGGLVRRQVLEQLRVGMQAIGLGLDVVPIEAAAHRSPWICVFVPEQTGWEGLSMALARPAASEARRWRILEAFACFVRRLHDAGLYNPNQTLNQFQVRIRAATQDFQVAELDGTSILRPMTDAAREEMLGSILASHGGSATNGVRFLRAYGGSDRVAREATRRLLRDLALRLRSTPKPKRRKAKLGRLVIDAFEVIYIKKDSDMGIDPCELQELYRNGLQAPNLKVIRAGDARAAWKSALISGPRPSSAPLACFSRRENRAGFVLYRAIPS